jgi:glycosyltransferase involved in cell wall biosynthesis
MMTPTVSVVVATHNRSARLSRLLDGLAVQEGVAGFEVVVVDDASTDDTAAMLAARGPDLPFELTVLVQGRNAGPAVARNRGWRWARAPLICFTDDDCVPTPKWLAQMVAAMDGADLVQGHTRPNPEQEGNWGPFSRSILAEFEEGYYETCNMAYRKELLEQLDGFDGTFRYPFGEDMDLAWRAKRRGAVSRFASEALVHHDILESNWRAALRDVRRNEGLVLVYRRHPYLRQQLGKGIFIGRPTNVATCAVAVAAVGLAVKPRSTWRWAVSAAAGGWYSYRMALERAAPRQGKWAWPAFIPGAYVVDLARVGVLLRAWVRYRTLVS